MVPIRYNIRNLLERKATTFMTALGIALTVAVLVTALALTAGLQSVFAETGDPRQFLVLRKGVDAELTSSVSNDTYQVIRNLPGIARTPDGNPMVSQEGLTVVNLPSVEAPDGMNVTVRGLLQTGLDMRAFTIQQGHMFELGKRQIAVGSAVASRYKDAQIGKTLKFGKGDWEVVGIFKSGDSAANSEMWADLNQLRGDFEQDSGSNSLLVRTTDPAAMKTLLDTIKNDQRLNVNTIPEKEYYDSQKQSGRPLQLLGFSVAVIMAVGSAFAATNTMYAAVARRAREIGILRALGFGRASVLFSFVSESVFLALLGGIIGVLLALPINGFATGVGNFQTFAETTFQFRITPAAAITGLLFAAFIGALGGILPAWAAAKKDVIQAMRDT